MKITFIKKSGRKLFKENIVNDKTRVCSKYFKNEHLVCFWEFDGVKVIKRKYWSNGLNINNYLY
jgi:hypothetical protein